jgi:hypothetical protein
MGHTEMRLAVAGLGETEILERASRLGSGDWSGFPAAERASFRFARKLTAEPWAVDDADWAELEGTVGTRRALDMAWHVAWANYMTRVADAFQLPLEKTNVFQPRKEPAPPVPEAPAAPAPEAAPAR